MYSGRRHRPVDADTQYRLRPEKPGGAEPVHQPGHERGGAGGPLRLHRMDVAAAIGVEVRVPERVGNAAVFPGQRGAAGGLLAGVCPVYAEKDGQYKICIELKENKICQERIDRNAAPTGEEKVVLSKWHERHGLKVVV